MTEDFKLANLWQQVMLRSFFSAFLFPRLDGALVCLCQLGLSHIREAENISERLKYVRETGYMSERLKIYQRG